VRGATNNWPERAGERAIFREKTEENRGFPRPEAFDEPLFKRTAPILVLLVILIAGIFETFAAQADWRRDAEIAFSKANDRMKAASSGPEALWQFARAAFDLAEYATNTTERAELANTGINAGRQAVKIDPKNAPARYYLGMNIGQLARTRYLSALKLVGEMEEEFIKAQELDASFDYAGPHRNLGLLYRDAPSIGSVGSRRKASHHLHKAVELAPDYPENRLNLIESLLKWGDKNGAIVQYKALEGSWESARKTLAEDKWKPAWADWEARRERVAKRLNQPSPRIRSPNDD
jgi:tetratricopeptide (TPR) repeat protein